ncbi:hypothetical protein XENOCAPTIV_024538, partial [Xenoophorus captivus]
AVHVAESCCDDISPTWQLLRSPPSLSQILCNDVMQWADHVAAYVSEAGLMQVLLVLN